MGVRQIGSMRVDPGGGASTELAPGVGSRLDEISTALIFSTPRDMAPTIW
jgi:hypothetical protein